MINKTIIELASNTSNANLTNNYSFKTSLKNSICGDKITLEITIKKKRINSMKYKTESCIYCEASASLLSQKIKNFNVTDIKKDFMELKKITNQKNIKMPKKYSDFNKLLNSDNYNRFKCIFLICNFF